MNVITKSICMSTMLFIMELISSPTFAFLTIELPGIEKCQNNPDECGLEIEGESYEAGYEVGYNAGTVDCQNNPAGCRLETEGSYDSGYETGIEACQNNPDKCGLEIEGSYHTGYDTGFNDGIISGQAFCQGPDNPCGIQQESMLYFEQEELFLQNIAIYDTERKILVLVETRILSIKKYLQITRTAGHSLFHGDNIFVKVDPDSIIPSTSESSYSFIYEDSVFLSGIQSQQGSYDAKLIPVGSFSELGFDEQLENVVVYEEALSSYFVMVNRYTKEILGF